MNLFSTPIGRLELFGRYILAIIPLAIGGAVTKVFKDNLLISFLVLTLLLCGLGYDGTDSNDVLRIREELRKLGIKNKISYKTDSDTHAGKYAVQGDKKISKYYE